MKFLVLLLFISTRAFAQALTGDSGQSSGSQPTANQSAHSEQTLDYAIGGASMAGGAALMGVYCPPVTNIGLCIMGAGLVTSGLQNVMQAMGRNGAINDTSGNGSFGGGHGGGSGGGTSGDSALTPLDNSIAPPSGGPNQAPLPSTIQSLLDSANKSAAQTGQSLGDLAAQGGSVDSQKIPADAQALANKAAKDFSSKYSVASVPIEGSAGGALAKHNETTFDLKSLMDGLNNSRSPASVEGLQRTFNGDAVGVAGDNIFKQISRRYRAKAQAHSFVN